VDSDTVRSLVIALLCVLAIGVAAATLNSAVRTDAGGGFGVGAPAPDAGAPDGTGPEFSLGNGSAGAGFGFDFPCYPVLVEPWAVGLIVAAFGLGGYLAYRRLGGIAVVAYALPVGIPLVLAHALLTACLSPSTAESGSLLPGEPGNISLPGGGSGLPGAGSGTTLTDPSVLLLVGLGLALAGAVALLFVSSSGDDPDPEESVAGPESPEDVAAVGRAAGAAADRIEDSTDVDNEVYRAWREMTRHLDVPNPESSTPAEFAAAAVEAGIDRDDVEELTALFGAVRYGGESPTEDRERRALEALRSVEEYADDGGGPGR